MASQIPMGLCKMQAVGFVAAIAPSLFSMLKGDTPKNREMYGGLVFGGRNFIGSYNNQPTVNVRRRRDNGEEDHWAGSVWWDVVPLLLDIDKTLVV
jgi:hypothetical protein